MTDEVVLKLQSAVLFVSVCWKRMRQIGRPEGADGLIY